MSKSKPQRCRHYLTTYKTDSESLVWKVCTSCGTAFESTPIKNPMEFV